MVATALVVFHHAALTYGAFGGWYWHERPEGASPPLTLFVTLNQAWFMGLFFLLAGYFTPGAYARKGPRGFMAGRLLRLGVPLLAYAVLLDPLTNAIARWHDVLPGWERRIAHGDFHPGPMWFAEALLLFSAAYVAWRRVSGPPASRKMPGDGALLVAALGVGCAAFLIRLVFPVDRGVGGMLPGYFASYVLLFAVGTMAAAGDWLGHVPGRRALGWFVVSIIAVVVLVASQRLLAAGPTAGGLNERAAVYAFFEPFYAWGVILGLLWLARRTVGGPLPAPDWLARRAFTVYIIHPPILVAVTRLLQPWHAFAGAKTLVAGSLACAGCLAVASLVLLVPGARRIL